MKKFDIILIIIFIILSFVPQIIFMINFRHASNLVAEIKVNGKLYRTIDFTKLKSEVIINLENNEGHNDVLVSKDGVIMKYADCRDKICLKEGLINKQGESIVCLPHNVIIYIKGSTSGEDPDIIVK